MLLTFFVFFLSFFSLFRIVPDAEYDGEVVRVERVRMGRTSGPWFLNKPWFQLQEMKEKTTLPLHKLIMDVKGHNDT